MKERLILFCVALLVFVSQVSLADIAFSTNFDGSEGYVESGLDRSIQTSAPHFNVPGTSGLYLPAGQAPDFGYVSKNPTAASPRAYYIYGEGANYLAGNSWSVASTFDFEGLDASTPASDTFLNSIGFSTSNSSSTNAMIAGIQKSTTQTDQYTFYISGGAFESVAFNYSDIGDDLADADDLSDKLQISFSLIKSATADEFLATATLSNVDTSTTLASLNTTFSNAAAYNSDLFGFINAGSITENSNWDLFKMYDFEYNAVPERQTYSMTVGGFLIFVILWLRHRKKRS